VGLLFFTKSCKQKQIFFLPLALFQEIASSLGCMEPNVRMASEQWIDPVLDSMPALA
jgi:hypothetical protein